MIDSHDEAGHAGQFLSWRVWVARICVCGSLRPGAPGIAQYACCQGPTSPEKFQIRAGRKKQEVAKIEALTGPATC